MKNPIGVLQGRLTPMRARGMQFFPNFPGEWQLEFPLARKAGLDCIELLVRKDSPDHPLYTQAGRRELVERSQDNELSLPSVHAFYESSDDYAKLLPRIVEGAHVVGAKVVLVSFFKERLTPTYGESWKKIRYLAAGARVADSLGIRLGIEAELPARSILSVIEYFDSWCDVKVFASYYDVGNQYARGFPVAQELELLRGVVAGVHIKDRLLQNENVVEESPSVALGLGCAKISEALSVLQKIHYRGPLIIQGARQREGFEKYTVKTYAFYVKHIIEDLPED